MHSVTKDRLIGHEDFVVVVVVVVLWNYLSYKHSFALRSINKGEEKHQSQLRFDKII